MNGVFRVEISDDFALESIFACGKALRSLRPAHYGAGASVRRLGRVYIMNHVMGIGIKPGLGMFYVLRH